jgi:hypothetical protein
MDSFRRSALLFFIPLLVFSCNKKQTQVSRAYYFWRTDRPSRDEIRFLKQHSVQKLYFHLIDVDWSEVLGAIPVVSNEVSRLNYEMRTFDSFPVQIVPVVFITNKTFQRIDSFDIPLLAKRLVRRCLASYDQTDKYYEQKRPWEFSEGALAPKEIQFDCDWTRETAGKYFSFLREVKYLLPSDSIKISATIRLHQFKYFKKTGVPPVSRGMLMMYNISDPKEYGESNSIFETAKVREYFTGNKYPLPVDIVLPAWSWCIVYRNQKFYQIENELDEKDLQAASFLRSKGHHIYSVTTDTVYHDLFLRPGDEIKAEGVDQRSLGEAAALAKKAMNTDSFTISFFELSEREFKNYKDETIDKIYNSFR